VKAEAGKNHLPTLYGFSDASVRSQSRRVLPRGGVRSRSTGAHFERLFLFGRGDQDDSESNLATRTNHRCMIALSMPEAALAIPAEST
jgi:hypothetical protein